MILSLALAVPVLQQPGPFTDGELLVQATSTTPGLFALYRIDPQTGDGVALLDPLTTATAKPGWLAYDPFRERVLVYTSWLPTSFQGSGLHAVAADGTVEPLGFWFEDLRGMAPTGDGRVYLTKSDGLYLLDANDQLAPVLDASGVPVDQVFDHYAYDAPTNSLVAVSTLTQNSACFQIWSLEFHRVPLNPAGDALSGPIVCTSLTVGPPTPYPVGLDPLPGGTYLVTLTNPSTPNDDLLLELDPATLTTSVWSTAGPNDLNGGVYVPSIGRAVVVKDDNQTDELLTYAPGQGGSGTPLVANVPVGANTTGQGSGNTLADVDDLGSPCSGFVQTFGSGLAGTGGFVPRLHVLGCPRIDSTLRLHLWDAVGGSAGVVVLGVASTAIPVFGGTGYVLPPFAVQLPFSTSGTPGATGAGQADVDQPLPNNPALVGLALFGQAGLLDGGAVEGIALTSGIELTVGS